MNSSAAIARPDSQSSTGFVARIWGSSLGKKYIMALTGVVLFGFVIGHLLGNLQIFLGREALNRYGHFLQTTPELLWPARIGLLVMVVLHIAAAIKLSRENRAARPQAYAEFDVVAANYAARTMLMTGLIVLCFIIYHLLHFTVQVPAINFISENFKALHDEKQRHDVYGMMIQGFSNPLVCLFYLAGVGLLCVHLSHGVASMFQSLGLKNKFYGRFIDRFAVVTAILLFVGYSIIPLAVLADRKLGLVRIFAP
jgi:succinate dehydrogenase / fumarate reductase cytochrome b subunit